MVVPGHKNPKVLVGLVLKDGKKFQTNQVLITLSPVKNPPHQKLIAKPGAQPELVLSINTLKNQFVLLVLKDLKSNPTLKFNQSFVRKKKKKNVKKDVDIAEMVFVTLVLKDMKKSNTTTMTQSNVRKKKKKNVLKDVK